MLCTQNDGIFIIIGLFIWRISFGWKSLWKKLLHTKRIEKSWQTEESHHVSDIGYFVWNFKKYSYITNQYLEVVF